MTQRSIQEIAEAAQLRSAVRDIESMIARGTTYGSANSILLAVMLDSAKGRLAEIERDEEEHERLERQKSVNELAMAYKAQQEAKLNAEEQRQYAEFLEKEHFTKSDFGKLESFYTNTWDRLSEDGKAEMSHRVWEGVRRKEYEFIDLPEPVKEKEAQRLYEILNTERPLPRELNRIPAQDKKEFLEAWKADDHGKAFTVLNRPSFAGNVALSSRSIEPQKVVESIKVDASTLIKTEKSKEASAERLETDGMGELDINLTGIKITSQNTNDIGPPPTAGNALPSKSRQQ